MISYCIFMGSEIIEKQGLLVSLIVCFHSNFS